MDFNTEGLALGMAAFESHYGSQFTLSTRLIKLIFCVEKTLFSLLGSLENLASCMSIFDTINHENYPVKSVLLPAMSLD